MYKINSKDDSEKDDDLSDEESFCLTDRTHWSGDRHRTT